MLSTEILPDPRTASSAIAPFGAILHLIRPRHWIKNLVCFLPVFCAGSPLEFYKLYGATRSFIAFCLVASFAYIVNDLADLRRDRVHPLKRFRPLATGKVSPRIGSVVAMALLALGLLSAWSVSLNTLWILLTYVVINSFYSLRLKQVAVLDVMTISAGFLLRLAAGGEAAGVSISAWLVLCAFFLSLFLAFGKRRAELNGPDPLATRKVLEQYSELILDRFSNISATLAIATYAVFTVVSRADHSLLVTCPPVVYGLFRYLLLVEMQREGEAPELILTKDRPIQIAIALWLSLYFAVLFLGLRVSVL